MSIYIHTYIYIYICVCVCVYIYMHSLCCCVQACACQPQPRRAVGTDRRLQAGCVVCLTSLIVRRRRCHRHRPPLEPRCSALCAAAADCALRSAFHSSLSVHIGAGTDPTSAPGLQGTSTRACDRGTSKRPARVKAVLPLRKSDLSSERNRPCSKRMRRRVARPGAVLLGSLRLPSELTHPPTGRLLLSPAQMCARGSPGVDVVGVSPGRVPMQMYARSWRRCGTGVCVKHERAHARIDTLVHALTCTRRHAHSLMHTRTKPHTTHTNARTHACATMQVRTTSRDGAQQRMRMRI